jgi:type I restriction enzyme M protein
MVFLRRLSETEMATPNRDYPIFFCVADKIGHDKRGNTIYCRDVDGADILAHRTRVVASVEGGQPTTQMVEELVPVIDDQLPEVAPLFQQWAIDHGV